MSRIAILIEIDDETGKRKIGVMEGQENRYGCRVFFPAHEGTLLLNVTPHTEDDEQSGAVPPPTNAWDDSLEQEPFLEALLAESGTYLTEDPDASWPPRNDPEFNDGIEAEPTENPLSVALPPALGKGAPNLAAREADYDPPPDSAPFSGPGGS